MTVVRAPLLLICLGLLVASFAPNGSAHHADTDTVPEFASPGPLQLYHHYTQLEGELQDLQQRFPDFFKYSIIGKSVLGLNIYGVEITNFKSPDPPLEDRYRIYFDGSIHSNEQLGMEAAMDIARWLLNDYQKDPLAKMAVDTRHTFIVPLVNPDGNVRDSRWNVNNVDLNRNFPHGWGGPGSAQKGDKPLSEPETRTVAGWLAKVRPHYSNSFHTGTLMLLHPFGNFTRETKVQSPDHDLFTRICQAIQEEMNKAAGRAVPCGQVYSTIYPASGTTVDYVYVEFGSNSWTFEVDNEQFLWVHPGDEASLRARLGETWAAVKHAYENVDRYGAVLEIIEVKTRVQGGAVSALEVKLRNTGMGASSNTLVGLKDGPAVSVNPPIEPDETRVVRVPVNAKIEPGGTVDLRIAYNRTFYKGFADVQEVSLEAVKQGSAVVLRAPEGVGSAVSVPDDAQAGTPGFELVVAMLCTVGALALLRRRPG